MDIKTRVRNILLTPNTEWPVIAEEPADTGGVVTGYVVPLAAIGAVAGFIGGSLVGMSLLSDYELRMRVRQNGKVALRRLTR